MVWQLSLSSATWRSPNPQWKAPYFLPDLIWRLSLGLNASHFCSVTLDIVFCRNSSLVEYMVIRQCSRSFTKDCASTDDKTCTRNLLIGEFCLVQLRWFPSYCSQTYRFTILWNKAELSHWSSLLEVYFHCVHRLYKTLYCCFCLFILVGWWPRRIKTQ